MQRAIYVCLIDRRRVLHPAVPARRQSPASRACPTSPPTPRRCAGTARSGSPTLDGLRGLDSDIILFWRWLFNSVVVTVCVVLGRVFLSRPRRVLARPDQVPRLPAGVRPDPRRDDGAADHPGDPPVHPAQGARPDQHVRRADPAAHVRRRRHLRDEAVHGADPRRDRGGGGDRRGRPVRRRSPRSSSRTPGRR